MQKDGRGTKRYIIMRKDAKEFKKMQKGAQRCKKSTKRYKKVRKDAKKV